MSGIQPSGWMHIGPEYITEVEFDTVFGFLLSIPPDDPRLCPDADMLDGDPYPVVEDEDE